MMTTLTLLVWWCPLTVTSLILVMTRRRLIGARKLTQVLFPFIFCEQVCQLLNISLLIGHYYEGKSKKEGVLITHNMFKFQKNNASRDYSTWWYTCSHKNTHGCSARAIIKRREFLGEDGELMVENELVEVATPEVDDFSKTFM